MSDESDRIQFSRRKLLGSVATIGAAGALGGAATNALLWDEEKFGTAESPNVLQAGKLDLKVDWEGTYYNWKNNPTISSDANTEDDVTTPSMVDNPGPIVNLTDVKPGDVMELTLSAHVYGNPAFLGAHYQEHADTEGGGPESTPVQNEPEQGASGDDSDDDGGELDEHMYVVVWHDDGDNIPGEVWTGETQLPDGEENTPDDSLDASTQEAYVMEVGDAQSPSDIVDTEDDQLVFAGTLAEFDAANVAFDSRNAVAGQQASTESFGDNACYQNSTTEYVGFLAWLPSDIPDVNDNVVQGDRIEFQFGVDAIQCRHNVGEDGTAMDDTLEDADAENNAEGPENTTPTPTPSPTPTPGGT